MLFALSVAALVLLAPEPEPVNHCDSLLIGQARGALSLARAAEKVHCGDSAAFVAEYAGTIEREDHLMRPGMTRTSPFRLTVFCDWAVGSLSIRETSGQGPSARVETTLVVRGRVARQGSANGVFSEVVGEEARGVRGWAARWLPASLARAAVGAASSCRPGEPVEAQGERLTPVTFAEAAGKACTLFLDADHRVARVETLAADQRLGDVCDWTRFGEWRESVGVAAAGKLVRYETLDSSTHRYDLSLVSFSSGPTPAGVFNIPSEKKGDIIGWNAAPAGSTVASTELVRLANGLWSLEVQASDSRVLVVERANDLLVFEAPDGDAVCSGIVAALRERFPDKPVSMVAPGHHHPASSGGLRAFSAAAAKVLATAPLEPYIRWLLSRPTSLGAPAVVTDAEPLVEFFTGERTIEAGDATVRMIDIGERSAHAFSYVVFYFPKAGIIFEGDLGYFPAGREVRAGPRLKGLVEEMERLRIEPTRLVQAWPVRGVRREVDWKSVVEAVRSEAAPPAAK